MLKVVAFCVVLVFQLLVDASTDNCTVPVLNYGTIKKLTDDFYWNWRKFRFVRNGGNYTKISPGTIIHNNSSVTLFCDTGYLLQGTSLKVSKITCSKGKWIPDPVCHLHNCTVPEVKDGTIKELKKGGFYLNWRRFKYEKIVTFVKIPIGTILPHNSSVTLSCDTGFSIQESHTKYQELTCTEGEWLPHPICILNGQRYVSNSTTKEYHFTGLSATTDQNGQRYVSNSRTKKYQFTRFSATTDQNRQRYISESITQKYPSANLSGTNQNNCTVSEVNYGSLKELNEGDFYWDWKKYQNVKRFNYVKIPIGTILPHNSSATLFCDTGYSLQGTSVKIQEITCTGGKWLPDPVCILNGQRYSSRNSTQNYQSASLLTTTTTTDQSIPVCRVNKNKESQLVIEPMKDQYRFGDYINLSCPPGQELTREVEIIMCMGTRWSDTLPDCNEM